MARANAKTMTITDEFAAKIKLDHKKERLMKWTPILVLVVMIVVFTAIMGNAFFSVGNLVALLNQMSIPLMVALGLTFVIMIGSIDLSINGTVGMAGSLAGVFLLNTRTEFDLGIWGLVLAIFCSVLIGFIIGMMHVKLKIPSFMVSFAFMNICIGIGMLSYGGIHPTIEDPFFRSVPQMSFLGIPAIAWVAIIVFVICFFIQEYTPFGRYVYAVGTDETVPRAVGVNVSRVKVMVFTLAGFCFGVAGVVGALRLGQGQVGIGTGLMFPAQAAVVIGGTALSGGKGGVVNTLIGVLIMTVLFNGLTMVGINPHIRTGIEGAIILIAVILTVKRGATIISK
ncbi:MAG: ABC transporter permease [Lachnospiraceae bacterium]|nr:ABC transporter permease [Lachnospiraceae bacterium]